MGYFGTVMRKVDPCSMLLKTAQHLFVHRRDPDDLTEEVHHLFGPRQAAKITMNDNAIEAVIDEDEKIAEQFGEQLHDRPSKTHQAWTGQAHG